METYGIIKTKKNKRKEDENKLYEMYYDYQEKVKYIKPHRILAINRGEDEGILNVSIDNNLEYIENYLKINLFIKKNMKQLYY